jgi:hypothetical protein
MIAKALACGRAVAAIGHSFALSHLMKAAGGGEPLAETMMPSTWASVADRSAWVTGMVTSCSQAPKAPLLVPYDAIGGDEDQSPVADCEIGFLVSWKWRTMASLDAAVSLA